MWDKQITFDRFVRGMLTGFIIFGVLYLVNYLSGVLLPFVVAWFLAYLMYPVVLFIQNKLHVKVRALAIIITMLLMIAVIGVVIYLIIPPMIEQIIKVGDLVENFIKQTAHTDDLWGTVSAWLQENRGDIEHFLRSKDFSDAMKATMPKVFSMLGDAASVVFSVVASCITLLYMFFILLDYEYLSGGWVKIFPKKNRPFWQGLMNDVAREMNNYIRGQGLVALIMGIMFCIGFTIIGFPMAIGMGVLIGIMDLIPYLHTFALIPCAFLSVLKAGETGQSVFLIMAEVAAIFIIVQIISDMVVTPKVMGKAMGLNPAILLLSLSVWGSLLGFIGLIVALPLTTLIMAYWQRYVTKETAEADG